MPGDSPSYNADSMFHELAQRTTANERAINDLATSQKLTSESIRQLSESMDKRDQTMTAGFTKLENAISQVDARQRSNSHVNWQKIGFMASAILVVLAWYMKSEISPVASEVQSLKSSQVLMQSAIASDAAKDREGVMNLLHEIVSRNTDQDRVITDNHDRALKVDVIQDLQLRGMLRVPAASEPK